LKENGNGRPEQCVANLLLTTRGEVPYERLKGLSSQMIDKPITAVMAESSADIEWVLSTYEPRININNVNFEDLLPHLGQFGLKIDVATG